QVAQAAPLPALPHARLVRGRRPHGRREALAAPLGAALELPRARRVDQDAVPQTRAEAAHVAVVERRAGIDGRAEDAWEHHDAVLAGVDAVGEGPVDLLVRGRDDVLLDHRHVLVAALRRAVD